MNAPHPVLLDVPDAYAGLLAAAESGAMCEGYRRIGRGWGNDQWSDTVYAVTDLSRYVRSLARQWRTAVRNSDQESQRSIEHLLSECLTTWREERT